MLVAVSKMIFKFRSLLEKLYVVIGVEVIVAVVACVTQKAALFDIKSVFLAIELGK